MIEIVFTAENVLTKKVKKFLPVPVKLLRFALPSQCRREGWDDESNQFEKCGSNFKEPSCGCHPDHCPDCCAEVHGFNLGLPGVIERSPIENHCSIKGNW